MKVLILGAGVIGVTTASFLTKRGYEVTVIDREPASAMECSFANGGQLSYNHAEPWASPTALRKAVKWIGQKDAPLVFPLRLDPVMWAWIFRFLSNCTNNRVRRNTETLLRLGLYSRTCMHRLQDKLHLDFNYQKTGKFFVFETQKDFEAALKQSEFQHRLGANFIKLSPEECLEREPAFSSVINNLVGGIYDPEDETGDVHSFTETLADYLISQGTHFLFDTTLESINVEGNKIHSVTTNAGELEADIYVMALGCYSPTFLRQIGIKVPIYPMKGYSISATVTDESKAPTNSVTHASQKIVYSRLGNVLRAAGTAEFAGYNDIIRPERIAMLKHDMEYLFPECSDTAHASEWACLRPSTPDGPPILGASPYKNLFLNTGHGTLGWTQAAGSAAIVANIIEEKQPEIDISGMTLERWL